MTDRERIINIINRKQVDRVPYSFDFTSVIADKLCEHYGIQNNDLPGFIGDSMLYLWNIGGGGGLIREGVYSDEFGVLWDYSGKHRRIGTWGTILQNPLPDASLDGYTFPKGDKPDRFKFLDQIDLENQDRFVIQSITGLFDICWMLRGEENYFMDMAGDIDFAARLMDKALEFNLGVITQIPDCVDGVRFGEDWGMQTGLMFGARLWRELLKPRLKIMYEATRKKGLRVFIHTCGNITELFPDIIELGVDVVHPIQPEAMDIVFLQREYGKDITMYGGVGTQSTLVHATPAQTVEAAKNLLQIFKSGGFIIGPAGAISTDAKMNNVIALIDFLKGGA